VAEALHAPLDVWVVRKVGAPDQLQRGLGAVAEGGVTFIDPRIQRMVGVPDQELEALVERKRREVAERVGRVVLATPVAARETLEGLRSLVEEVVCLEPAENLWAIGAWYADFRQVADEEVLGLLEGSARRRESAPSTGEAPAQRVRVEEVLVDAGEVALPGTLSVPEAAHGLVLFAHGSGSRAATARATGAWPRR